MGSNHINSTIQCTVGNCAYHNGQGYCTLNQIHVGNCEQNATSCRGTQCASFQMSSQGGMR